MIIRVENLGKLYRIGEWQNADTLRDALTTAFRKRFSPSYRRQNPTNRPDGERYLWALKNISFEVKRGETLGIIGANGAGKTTILKILSRITEPTEGSAEIRGRVGSLLEAGTGFHSELTGRENVYFNGAILGMRKREIESKFDEIVAFADLERFIDTPIKRYSTGMQMRLGFSVAAHLETEIMVVDEVLAVGDAAFQKKCLGTLGQAAGKGRTVLFVSHNMGAIRGLCRRAIRLDQGRIVDDGESGVVVARYLSTVTQGFVGSRRKTLTREVDPRTGVLTIEQIVFRNSRGEKKIDFAPGDDVTVEIHFRARKRIRRPYFWVRILSQFGPIIGADMTLDGHRVECIEGAGMTLCTFKSIPLLPQVYTVRAGVYSEDGINTLAMGSGFFNVLGKMADFGFRSDIADMQAWESAPVVIPYEWHLPDGRAIAVEIGRRHSETLKEGRALGGSHKSRRVKRKR